MVIELRTVEFDPRQASRAFYEGKIAELTAQYEADQRTVRATLRELSWWKQALEMFIDPPPEGVPTDVAPTTLSDAILAAFDGDRAARLKPNDVIERMKERATLPTAPSGHQMVRNRMLSMMERNLLSRDDDGGYSLAPRGVRRLASQSRGADMK